MTTTRPRPALAIAGVTAGLASVFTPSTAVAAPQPQPQAEPAPERANSPSTAALPVCAGATRYDYSDGVFLLMPSVGNNDGNLDCQLYAGHSGNGVRKLQGALHHCYNNNVPINGQYDQVTRDAVAAVQRVKQIPVDGVYGPQTRRAMQWAFYEQSNNAFSHCTFVGTR